MKVVTDTYGNHDDGPDVISVQLDDGTEVYAATIVEDDEGERAHLEQALRKLVFSETMILRADLELWKDAAKARGELALCYRTGKAPSEKLHDRLRRARALETSETEGGS